MSVESDAHFLQEAYLAALSAVGNSDPNPAVGAVVVSASGVILARGSTQRAGFAHAERDALAQLGDADLSGATLYVTLEPCCHHGRTPPCVDAIIERKLKRVVIAERDFAAEVQGRSVQLLQEHGVDVTLRDTAAYADAAWLTTGPFFLARKENRPRITLKWAQTRDGFLAPDSGPSGAISGPTAAFVTAALRSTHKFTLATPGAVRADHPRLTVRFSENSSELKNIGLTPNLETLLLKQPALQQNLRLPDQTGVKPPFRGLLAPALNPIERGELYQQQGAIDKNFRFFPFQSELWRHDFAAAMTALLKEILALGYNSILVEAGPVFSALLLEHDLVDALAVYRARTKTGAALWGNGGRGNAVSLALAAAENPPAPAGFEPMEHAVFAEDEFFFYRRKR